MKFSNFWVEKPWLTNPAFLADEPWVDESTCFSLTNPAILVDEPWLTHPPFWLTNPTFLLTNLLVDESAVLVDESDLDHLRVYRNHPVANHLLSTGRANRMIWTDYSAPIVPKVQRSVQKMKVDHHPNW